MRSATPTLVPIEALWWLNTAAEHQSLNFTDRISYILQAMFPYVEMAKKFVYKTQWGTNQFG